VCNPGTEFEQTALIRVFGVNVALGKGTEEVRYPRPSPTKFNDHHIAPTNWYCLAIANSLLPGLQFFNSQGGLCDAKITWRGLLRSKCVFTLSELGAWSTK
jgi:hypothetical protein